MPASRLDMVFGVLVAMMMSRDLSLRGRELELKV
jgi:hypothetical protein